MQKSRLEQYGMLVAGAAGVAAAGTAGAAVVVNAGNVAPGTVVNNSTVALDLDNDGNVDINIVHSVGGGFYGNDVVQATGGAILAGFYAAGFGATSIGTYASPAFSASFSSGAGYMRDGSGFANSGWSAFPDSFLAVQFTIGGNTHYGFVEVSIDAVTPGTTSAQFPTAPNNVATIVSYGYQDQADTALGPIPEPGSLGLLALGAVGLLSRRKKSA